MASPALPDPDGDFAGPWYTWWSGDRLPDLRPLPGLVTAPADDDRALAALADISIEEVAARRHGGHRPYLARLAGEAVACGWATGDVVEIGEIGLTFTLPPGERYLWGFVTAERWRGHGIYPRLLQAILRQEGTEKTRYWIGHTPDNSASARGIMRAGFRRVGDVFFQPGARFSLVPVGPIDRARAGAALLGAEVRDECAGG
jgi:RimJ/RimL family protein N-acetyltransferase